MANRKICPKCSCVNQPNTINCIHCGISLNEPPMSLNRPISDGQPLPPIPSLDSTQIAEPYFINKGDLISTDNASYKIIEKIGEGGFASVFQVQDTQQRNFAMKILDQYKMPPQDAPEISTRFMREYKFGTQINSVYAVHNYDWGKIKGNPFFLMTYCPNGTLTDQIKTKPLIEYINRVAMGILNGLEDLHNNGCIHRDLKPDNILFDSNNRPLLADFGISAYINNRITRTNWLGKVDNVWGTIRYMPPEQFDHSKAFKLTGPYTDIFAFGVTMYEWLSGGYFPYGNNDNEMENLQLYVQRVKTTQYIPLRQYNTSVPDYWIKIIDTCLQPTVVKRYADTQAIKSIIKTHLSVSQKNNGNQRPLNAPNKPQRNGECFLEILNGEESGRTYNLTMLVQAQNHNYAANVAKLTIGWYDESQTMANDISIKESCSNYISRKHATIELFDGKFWYIRDGQFCYDTQTQKHEWKNSLNGTAVNYKPISAKGYYLQHNDIISIGDVTLRFEIH